MAEEYRSQIWTSVPVHHPKITCSWINMYFSMVWVLDINSVTLEPSCKWDSHLSQKAALKVWCLQLVTEVQSAPWGKARLTHEYEFKLDVKYSPRCYHCDSAFPVTGSFYPLIFLKCLTARRATSLHEHPGAALNIYSCIYSLISTFSSH